MRQVFLILYHYTKLSGKPSIRIIQRSNIILMIIYTRRESFFRKLTKFVFAIQEVEYYRDIHPIFEAVCKYSWVNEMAFRGHGQRGLNLYNPGNFLNPILENDLKDPGPDNDERKKRLRFVFLIQSKIVIFLNYKLTLLLFYCK